MTAKSAMPMACRMDALDAGQRARYGELIGRLRGATLETLELPDGFAFRLPPAEWSAAAEFISLERLCCPFLGFALELEREAGWLWLRLTGRDGVKAFLKEELSL